MKSYTHPAFPDTTLQQVTKHSDKQVVCAYGTFGQQVLLPRSELTCVSPLPKHYPRHSGYALLLLNSQRDRFGDLPTRENYSGLPLSFKL